MLARLQKVWRFFRQKDEFCLTPEESKVFSEVLFTLSSTVCYSNELTYALWSEICRKQKGMNENNTCDAMKSLAKKLLRQTDYE